MFLFVRRRYRGRDRGRGVTAAVSDGCWRVADPHGPKASQDLGHHHGVGLVAPQGEELAQDELDHLVGQR